jgi:hypothetical protein
MKMASTAATTGPAPRHKPARRHGRAATALALSGLLYLASLTRTRAEDRVDYRYEDYAEEGGRIHVRTHGVYFDAALKSWLSLKGNYIHDAISGATPTGAPPLPGQTTVPKAMIDEIRNAGFLEPTFRIKNHSLSPQFAYSTESDYESVGISLSDAIELNEKNTTLAIGLSHAFDRVLPNEGASITEAQDKGNTDGLLGVTQLLGPQTTLTANLTLGYADGYLSDPYKRVLFDDFPYNPGQPYTVWAENRPGHKFRQVAYLSLQHYSEKVRGAAELSYRFLHDDWGVLAHTLSVQWNQKIGKILMVSPLFRFYTQTEADFYGTHFPGDPDGQIPLPPYYSADYRLSALNSFTYGVSLTGRIHEHLSLAFSYKRYEMFGTDGVTAADQYPKANVFTGGLTIWF